MNGRLTTITQSLYYVSVNGKKNICRHLYLLKSVCLNSYGFYGCVNLFLLLISLTVAEDKNSILTRKHCCHLSYPVLSVRPGSKCPNTRRGTVYQIIYHHVAVPCTVSIPSDLK
jgi:hypothetical protein